MNLRMEYDRLKKESLKVKASEVAKAFDGNGRYSNDDTKSVYSHEASKFRDSTNLL